MTVKEAILTLNANVVFACERAEFSSATVKMIEDALDTIEDELKAQEPVKPRVGHDGWYRCGGCNNPLASGERVKHFYGHPWPKYCEECGRAVKWDG